jgi:hypothetical protein
MNSPPFRASWTPFGTVELSMFWVLALLAPATATAQVRTVVLTDEVREKPIAVSCRVAHTTRVVFPEPSKRLKVSPGAKEQLGIRFVATQPRAVVEITPVSAGASGTIEFTGVSGVLTVRLAAIDGSAASEVRLALPEAPAPGKATPAASPRPPTVGNPRPLAKATRSAVEPDPVVPPSLAPVPAGSLLPSPSASPAPPAPLPAASPTPTPVPATSATASPAVAPLDVSELLQLRPVVIGRREGLPGQRPVVLEDALKSQSNVWLRFRVVGGSKDRVASISWEHGALTSFVQASEGKDLRVVVRLPRAEVSKKSRVRIRLEGEKTDRAFALGSPWLSSFLRSLVE